MACAAGQALTAPATLNGLSGSLCDAALDDGAVCCSSVSLDAVEQDLRGLAATSAQCFAVRQRIQCAEACDPERTGWWDPSARVGGVAHLCEAFCEQLYTECYQMAGQTLTCRCCCLGSTSRRRSSAAEVNAGASCMRSLACTCT